MQIKEIEVDKLISYTRNPRNNKGAVAKTTASIKEYGFRQPIVVYGEMQSEYFVFPLVVRNVSNT